ncbi:sarcosine oxidase subunit gamma [Fluviibacterium sp. DFM31]|uniref:Sarcosine oxidase subunit gamma n=1 Tax=Meridianimarinicoccus marinus TaxID=3231483 RepID=A0ABV3L7N3_9RHOB
MPDLLETPETTVKDLPPGGMILVRGSLADAGFSEALTSCGITVPDTRQIAPCVAGQVGWMSPDELLVFCDASASADLTARLDTALAGQHTLVQRVDDMRARFRIAGPGARVALAKLCPVDMARIAPGELRRTRLAQIPAAFWTENGTDFDLLCFRSVATYARDVLTQAARHTQGIVLP